MLDEVPKDDECPLFINTDPKVTSSESRLSIEAYA